MCSNILAAQSYGEHIPTFKVLSIVFNLEKILINLKHQDVAVPLSLQFQHWYSWNHCFLLEVVPVVWRRWGASQHWHSWEPCGSGCYYQFKQCRMVLHTLWYQGESFKIARNNNVQAPIDLAIITWKVTHIPSLHALFLKIFRPSWKLSFQLLLAVIYSNWFICQTVSKQQLKVQSPCKFNSDICHSEAHIVSVWLTQVKARSRVTVITIISRSSKSFHQLWRHRRFGEEDSWWSIWRRVQHYGYYWIRGHSKYVE